MIIATFGPSTGWVGKTVRYDDGRFILEGFGEIDVSAVVDYDRQGHLIWAYAGLREWVYETAGLPAPAGSATLAATEQAAPTVAQTGVTQPSVPQAASEAAPAASPAQPVVPPAPSAAPEAYAAEAVPPVTPEAPATPTPTTPTPVPPAPPTTAPAESPLVAPPAARGRGGWFVLGGVVALAAIVGLVVAGGRIRDGLGVAFTLLAVAALVTVVLAATRSAPLSRGFGGAAPRTLLVASGVAAAVCVALAATLWWMPHFQVVAPSDTRIALDGQPEIKLLVVNRGLFGGTFTGAWAVDGLEQDAFAFPLGGGDARELTLSLPADTGRGPVTLTLGGASVEARAVLPPTFAVAPLEIDPSPAKVGDDVVLTTTVENTGDLAGTFDGVLRVGGEELLTQPVDIRPGSSVDVSYEFAADAAGKYRLALGDATAPFVIVQPVRLKNGYVIKRSLKGGRAAVTLVNKAGADAVAVFTRSGDKRRAVLAVYVRAGKKARITGIPDGTYVFWNCIGSGFNWTMRGFYDTLEFKRWVDPLKFKTTQTTKRWTTYWSDARYNYSQGHRRTTTHWTNWTITLATGESKYTKTVEAAGFPGF